MEKSHLCVRPRLLFTILDLSPREATDILIVFCTCKYNRTNLQTQRHFNVAEILEINFLDEDFYNKDFVFIILIIQQFSSYNHGHSIL